MPQSRPRRVGRQLTVVPESRRRARREQAVTYVVRVELAEIEPRVWRRFEIASDMMLDRVHDVLQVVMGWTDYHLHAFSSGGDPHDPTAERYLDQSSIDEGLPGVDERRVRLDEVLAESGERLWYQYDFGDSWMHTLDLEEVLADTVAETPARCLAGARACPPEDCGGVGGYDELLQALAGPPGPNRDHMRAWAGEDFDPERFDVDQVNGQLASRDGLRAPTIDPHSTLGALLGRIHVPPSIGAALDELAVPPPAASATDRADAVRHYSWLLDRVGDDGVKLTASGYLPPALVRDTAAELQLDDLWMKSANREGHTVPVLHFRASAQNLGLLRKAHNRLLLTKAGRLARHDPEFLWNHIAGTLPLGQGSRRRASDAACQAGALVLLGVAAGLPNAERRIIVVDGLNAYGWRTGHGNEMTADSVYSLMLPTVFVLDYLRVLPVWDGAPRQTDEPVSDTGRAFVRAALGV